MITTLIMSVTAADRFRRNPEIEAADLIFATGAWKKIPKAPEEQQQVSKGDRPNREWFIELDAR